MSKLPEASLDKEKATLLCDPEQNQSDSQAGETVVFCYDGLLLGLRALSTTMDHVDRLYLRRTPCATSPCTSTELAIIVVTGWLGPAPTSVTIDFDHSSATVPYADPTAAWPTPTSPVTPPVERPKVAGAPTEVLQREPFPFCGDAAQDRHTAMTCFLDAVAAGRPAEMLDVFDVSGGQEVFRYSGAGPVSRYAKFAEGWFKDSGAIVLGTGLGGWSYDNSLPRTRVG
jgi:hypothetical protein